MSSQTSDTTLTSQSAVCQVQRAGVVQPNPESCLACRECEVVCSLSHEGQCNPERSRIRIDSNDFVAGYPAIRVCKQCDWPACYYACAGKWGDSAIVIDARTGVRYIDANKCRGCGTCARACPLTPEREVIAFKKVGRKRVYFKCDLCKDRPEGPLCVEICPGKALTCIPATERRG